MGLKGLLTSVRDATSLGSSATMAGLTKVASEANLASLSRTSGSGLHRSSSAVFSLEKLSADSSDLSGALPRRKPGYVSFVIPRQVFCWMKKMAVQHNYGSVNKSIRDVLLWAAAGEPDDVDWMFTTYHDVPSCLDTEVCMEQEQEARDIAQKYRGPTTPCNKVITGARLSDALYSFVMSCIVNYDLESPSDVLEVALRCAISLGAADDIFGEHEQEFDLPRTTADLYHDLGIIGLPTSPATSLGVPTSPATSIDLSLTK